MKIANWNIEWMNHWFSGGSGPAALRPSGEIPGGVSDVEALCARVAAVIAGLRADVLTLQEGPSRREEMALFVDQFLNSAYAVHGPSGKGAQKLYVLVRQNGAAQGAQLIPAAAPLDLSGSWEVDIDGNLALQPYAFTREPLVLEVTDAGSARRVRIINVHLKSKFVRDGERMWRDPARKQEFIREALLARRRISAEAMRLRAYLDALLDEDIGRAVVVCGDYNDGPGSDFFEQHYLTHNLVAAIAGNPFEPPFMLRHGFIDRELPNAISPPSSTTSSTASKTVTSCSITSWCPRDSTGT